MKMKRNNPLIHVQPCHRVALLTHMHPDGDAYGSLLGMKHLLSQRAYQVDAYAEADPASKFAFLPGFAELKTTVNAAEIIYDICIVLDCGNAERTGDFQLLLKRAHRIINIDHHISNTFFGHVQYIIPAASSTSEMITQLAQDFNILLQPEEATCLLTGIVMDTGSFLYENTSAATHQAAAHLLDAGANHDLIRFHLFQNRPLQNVRFLGYLIEHMELLMDKQAVLLTVSDALLAQYEVAYEDLDEFISYVRDISGIELAVILKEINGDEVKISFRSKSWLDVNKLAAGLNGGGHERAAGAVFNGSLAHARRQLLPLIEACFTGGSCV
ncbi:MAG: bifunctional oligoribonuclease/PAP phosphatase NrnA [Bacillota bacterium]|nr:bifunctional oligoribonuclease/PAP phosphatase NrnA [Bacillota bacterium]MDW7676051.1 bifunctional oligoribonuclease/PAP phosphatase NrnA [Bacillota bacterium]